MSNHHVIHRFRLKAFEAITAKVSFADSLTKLSALNKCIDEATEKKLKDAYADFEREYKEHVDSSNFFKRDFTKMAQKIRNSVDTDTPQAIVAGVFAVWSLDSCRDVAHERGSTPPMMRPLPVQVLAIFRMLGVDQDGWFERMKRKIMGGGAVSMIRNHLVQIKTGEGKSVVLGVLATVLALSGYNVDCVCYSQYLSRRDRGTFANVFDYFKVGAQVKYATFAELSEQVIDADGNVRDLVEDFLHGHRSKKLAVSKMPRILLIDEVDVFFSADFYGATYNPVTTYSDKLGHVHTVQRFIWAGRMDSFSAAKRKLEALEAYTELLSAHKLLKDVISNHSIKMLRDVREEHTYELKDGLIAYRDQDIMSTTIRHGYLTLFAYFKEHEAGNITEESLTAELGLSIHCGHFSYAELPSKYSQILGVTGTLDSLGELCAQAPF